MMYDVQHWALIAPSVFCGAQNANIRRWKLSASKIVWEVSKQYVALFGMRASFVVCIVSMCALWWIIIKQNMYSDEFDVKGFFCGFIHRFMVLHLSTLEYNACFVFLVCVRIVGFHNKIATITGMNIVRDNPAFFGTSSLFWDLPHCTTFAFFVKWLRCLEWVLDERNSVNEALRMGEYCSWTFSRIMSYCWCSLQWYANCVRSVLVV